MLTLMENPTVNAFERRISPEESEGGYLRVEDEWLERLPEPGHPFKLRVGKSELRVRIDREDGVDGYKIDLPLIDLEPGSSATLRVIRSELVTLDLP